MKKTLIVFIIILLGYVHLTFSQNMIARTSASRVPVGEPFEISFTVEGNATNFTPPKMNDLQILSGPNQSQNMSYINGQVSQSITLSYYVTPKREGTIVIAGAAVIVGGNTIACAPLKIEATKPDPSAAKLRQEEERATMERKRQMMQDPFSAFFSDDPFFSGGNQQRQKQQQVQKTSLKDNIFMRVSLNKTRAYVGEPVIATFKIYTRVGVAQAVPTELPKFNGFWQEEIEIKNQKQYTESVNGIQFTVAEIKQTILYPQRAGILFIEPYKLDAIVQQQNAPRNIFEQMFGSYQNVPITVQSQQQKVQVLSLPKAPVDFNGFSGKLSLASTISAKKVKTNDAVTIKLVLSGSGNFSLLESPKLDIPSDIESYDPKVEEKINRSINGVSGVKIMEYLIIPRVEGNFEIPGKTISYFDYQTKSYKQLSIPSFPLQVEKGIGNTNATITAPTNASKQVKVVNDILYAKQYVSVNEQNYFFRSTWFYILLLLILVGATSLFYFTSRKKAYKSDVTFMNQKSAKKIAKARLKKASDLLQSNNSSAFYTEIHQALIGYLNHKFNIPLAEMTKENIESKLFEKQLDNKKIEECLQLINDCELTRYSPSQVKSKQTVYENTLQLIHYFES